MISITYLFLQEMIELLNKLPFNPDTLERFSYWQKNLLVYKTYIPRENTFTGKTEVIDSHEIREFTTLARTHYDSFPPEKIEEQYKALKPIILLTPLIIEKQTHTIVHELVHLLSSDYFDIDENSLTQRIGINRYVYIDIEGHYLSQHQLYPILNELMSDYIANILHTNMLWESAVPRFRCFPFLKFDNYLNQCLHQNHFTPNEFIKAYFEFDEKTIIQILQEDLASLESRCALAFSKHQSL